MNFWRSAIVFVSLFLSHSVHALANDWEFRESKDRLTDAVRFTIARIADNGSGPLRRPPFLVVQCTAKKAVLVINVRITGIADNFEVQYRLDKNPATSIRMRSIGSDSLAVIGKEALDLIGRFEKHSEL